MRGLLLPASVFFQNNLDEMVRSLAEMYPDANGSQVSSWRTLLSDIANSDVAKQLPADCLLGVEFSLPTDGMAIDFLVAGRTSQGKEIVFIIESKQWNDSYIESANLSFHRTADSELHPQVQVLRHKLSFSGYLDIGPVFETIPCVFIRNCSKEGLRHLAEKNLDPVSQSVAMYRDMDELFTMIMQRIASGCPDGVELFSNAEYTPSRGIIDAMASIISREPPFILTPEQEQITEQIRNEIRNGKKVIRVIGAAGAGKTAILLNLYINLLNEIPATGIKPVFVCGAQNTAYYQSKFPEVRNSFTYSFSLDRMIGPRCAGKRIILMDEAQHNQPGIISDMVQRGATLVLCYDAGQIINADNALPELASLEKRDDFVSLELHRSVRFNGSDVAEQNINACLDGKTDFLPDDKFEFRLLPSFAGFQEKIFSVIREHPDKTVAVTGLLSSDADDYTIKNNNQSLLFTDWTTPNKWEKAECRWMPYITSKNYLSQNDAKIWVGTWWMPGLDVDYIFVIVGGDAKMTRNGLVAIPERAKHFRMMESVARELKFPDEVFSKKAYLTADRIKKIIKRPENTGLAQRFLRRFSELLRNNYYIMMSRGRKGCFVFFTDNDNA